MRGLAVYRSVGCLHDSAKSIATDKTKFEMEKAWAWQWNGYPPAFVRAASKQSTPKDHAPEVQQREGKPTCTLMLSFVAGISGRIRKACKNYNIRVVIKSNVELGTYC